MSVATITTCPGVTPIVELGVGASYDDTSTAQWDVDHWDDDTSAFWVGDMPYWLDVTCHVQDIATFAGRERSIDQWEVGTATVTVDNRDGLFDFPLSMADLADDATLLSIRPGRSIRIGVQIDDDTTFLWAGYIDSANPQYDAVDGARMILECVDAKGDAGRTDVAALATAVGASETVTQRITRVLNAAGWPAYRRSIDTSGVTLIATELGGQCVDLLNIAADSAGGHVFGDLGVADSDPKVAFRGRDFLNYDNADPPPVVIADTGFPGIPEYHTYVAPMIEDPAGSGLYYLPDDPIAEDGSTDLFYPTGDGISLDDDPDGSDLYEVVGDLVPAVPADTCPSNWELSFARSDISTQALLGRQTDDVPRTYPTPAMLADVANGTRYGLAMFGVETFERTDLETLNDADLDWLGERILTLRSWKLMPRVNAVTVTAKGTARQTYDTLTQASPFTSSRFTCRHVVDGRVVFDRIMMVTGVAHSITPFGWEARISLDDAEPFLVGGAHPALWDETGVALWDSATWADPT